MSDSNTNVARAITETARLTAPDVLGFYSHFEATEIFAVRDGDHSPLNVALCDL
jgi:hypothetical protein